MSVLSGYDKIGLVLGLAKDCREAEATVGETGIMLNRRESKKRLRSLLKYIVEAFLLREL